MTHIFSNRTKMIIEKNAVMNNKNLLCLGKKAIIITSKSAAAVSGALVDVTTALSDSDIPYSLYSDIMENPTYESVREASAKAIDENCDFVIGIGGGSPLDAAKAVAVLIKNADITEDEFYKCNFSSPAPIALVGTTAGTGSEVTPYSIITNSKGIKLGIGSESILPVVSFGDITYLTTMPKSVLRSTLIDALSHAIESYFSKSADDFSKTFSLRAIKLLIPEMETISAYGDEGLDDKDYEALYLASIYAGYAIAKTGTAFPHLLSYYLSENHGIPHGAACGIFLPAFILHNERWAPTESALLFDEVLREQKEVINLIEDILPDYDLKLKEEEIEAIKNRVANNNKLSRMYGEVSADYLAEIIRAILG